MKAILFPGQGAQYPGMGKDLFDKYKSYIDTADNILGYSIKDLCVNDNEDKLRFTQFTQPALFVVGVLNFLEYQKKEKDKVDFYVGHSLGEYNALFAAGAFDFETGLKLVKKRGQLMGEATDGAMAAVLGLSIDKIEETLIDTNNQINTIDIANYNTPTQTVISGKPEDIQKASDIFEDLGARFITLNVSAAFHSRYMKDAQNKFREFVGQFTFSNLETPVIANVTARPYKEGNIADILSQQISNSVLWTRSIRFLMGKNVSDYLELGSHILSKMVHEIKEKEEPIYYENDNLNEKQTSSIEKIESPNVTIINNNEKHENNNTIQDESWLGSESFKDNYSVKYAYVAGAMRYGVSSENLVERMANSGLLSFLSTDGLDLEKIESSLIYLQKNINDNKKYGIELSHNPVDTSDELQLIKLCLKYNIKCIEAVSFSCITPALVLYRIKGITQDAMDKKNNVAQSKNNIIAHVPSIHIANEFMLPPPFYIVKELLDNGLIDQNEANLSQLVPMSCDICISSQEDKDIAIDTNSLLSSVITLKEKILNSKQYPEAIRVGQSDNIGDPQSVAIAFLMGSDFVVSKEVNQCTVEANTSNNVKDLLQNMTASDVCYAPSIESFDDESLHYRKFEKVLNRGVIYASRVSYLFNLYQNHNSILDIPEDDIKKLESKIFNQSISSIVVEKNKNSIDTNNIFDEKQRMLNVFKNYLDKSIEYDSALNVINLKIITNSCQGALNTYLYNSPLSSWKNRHIDILSKKIVADAEIIVKSRCLSISA